MASSVARMPNDDWRDPGRLPGSIFGAHAHNPFLNNGLRKIFVRDKTTTDNSTSTNAPSSDNSTTNANEAKGEETNAVEGETNINPFLSNGLRKIFVRKKRENNGIASTNPNSKDEEANSAEAEIKNNAKNVAPVIIPTTKNESNSQPAPNAKKRAANNNSRNSGKAEAEEESSPPSSTKQRQSQILDRWAARQAREMVTTIQRQAHEAEISALTTKTLPVAARAASFLRETSPSNSETSSMYSACPSPLVGTSTGNADGSDTTEVGRNVRASSLIQMWRELEAEAGLVSSTPRSATAASAVVNSPANSAVCFSADEPPVQSEGFDESEWDSDSFTVASSLNSSLHSSLNEVDRRKVSSIVKMLTLANRTVLNESSFEENDQGDGARSVGATNLGLTPAKQKEQRNDEEWVAKMGLEMRQELAALATQFRVSQFSYRGRLQSMLRLRSLRRQVSVQDELICPSTQLKLDVQNGTTITFLSERFNKRQRNAGRRKASMESLSSVHFQFPLDSEGSGYMHSDDQFISYDNQRHQRAESRKDSEIAIPGTSSADFKTDKMQVDNQSPASSSDERPEAGSPNFACDDLQEPNGSWDERNLWGSSLDWQRPTEASTSSAWQGEVINQEIESNHKLNKLDRGTSWEGEPSEPWRGWSARRQPSYDDLIGTFSDNEEIRELLERRTVSTSLSSSFTQKMNKMILSFANKIQQQQYYDDNYVEEYEEQPFWGNNKNELENVEQLTSAPSSLVPVQLHTPNQTESWQNNALTHYPAQNRTDIDTMQHLRSDMQQIRDELSELRSLMKSFIEYQGRFENSVRQEISDTIRQAGISSCNGNSTGRKACCICKEKQVDSLLYRCGHMCTCYKCAYELQWGSGKCPICRLPIQDIVRVSQ